MSVFSAKKELRVIIRKRRAAISVAARRSKDAAICATLTKFMTDHTYTQICSYYAINSEPDLAELARQWQDKKKLALPCIADRHIVFRAWRSGDKLLDGKFNLKEPAPCPAIVPDRHTLVLVPCLALDEKGNRLGYGGGYYDRFLSDYAVTSVGICYQRFLFAELPVAPHDRKVNYIVTEKGDIKVATV